MNSPSTKDGGTPTEGTTESYSKENQPNTSSSKSASGGVTKDSPAPNNSIATTNAASSQTPPSAVDFEPPVACVRRILKNTLHAHTNVGKDSVTAFARASGIFIIYVTACANDFARENRRQTITANDVLAAIKELEFDEFTPELTKFLEMYRESEKSKKTARAKAASAKSQGKATAASPVVSSYNDHEEDQSKLNSPESAKSAVDEEEDDEEEDDEGYSQADASMAEQGDDDDEDQKMAEDTSDAIMLE